MKCIKCGRQHNDYHFRVLQVQTFHVRDFGKNSKVQALGEFEEYDVCAACAREKQASILDTGRDLRRIVLPWGIAMVLGLVLCFFFWNGEGVLRLAGLGLLGGGALCMYGGLQNAGIHRRELRSLTPEDALHRCAWECLVDAAPKKNDVNDITYIPADETTLARKNGDLMILYDLVPEIAVQAHKRLHGIEETPPATE